MSATLLPNGKQQFLDSNGDPLAGGSVAFYVPGTTTPKNTWQDAAETILNTNPVILDMAGEALIYGSGQYRQVVKDANGVLIWDQLTQDVVSAAGISDAMEPVVGSSTVKGALELLLDNPIDWAPNQQAIVPGEEGAPILCNLVINNQTSNSGTTRQFSAFIQTYSTQNSVVGSKNGDDVCLFTSIRGGANSGDIWSMNPCLQTDADFPPDGNSQILECDFNNLQGDRGGVPGPGGVGEPFAFGVAVSGNSLFHKTAGFAVGGFTANEWHRGFCVQFPCVDQAAFCDYSNAVIGLDIEGIKSYGIDFNNMTSGACIRIKNQGNILGRNAANTADLGLITIDNDGVQIGWNVPGTIGVGNSFIPLADNSYSCGGSTNRWSAVWAVNGAIQTSDPSLKTDIAALPESLPLVAKINPVTFKWIDGGSASEEVEEEQTVQDTVHTEYYIDDVEVRDGKAYAIKRLYSRDDPAFDTVPVLDDSGNPIFDTVPSRDAVLDKKGNILQAARQEQKVARTHRIPRMVTKKVKVVRPVAHPGKRTHWGFLADDVKAAFDSIGMDFGGYVKDTDGTQALRPSQLIPVLWKAVQELSAEVSALKAKVGA